MADRSVALRLATEGKATVVSDLNDIGGAGDAAAKRWAKSFDQAGDQVLDAMRRQNQAAAKLDAIAPQTSAQRIYQAGASTNYDGASARESAVALKQLLDEQDALDRSAASLKARLDPLTEAQRRYNAEIAEANELSASGRITAEQLAQAEQQAAAAFERARAASPEAQAMREAAAAEADRVRQTQALRAALDPAVAAQQRYDDEVGRARALVASGNLTLDEYCAVLRRARGALDGTSEGHARMGASGMMAEHVMRALSDSIAAGQSPMVALSMETGRIVEGLALWAQQTETTEGAAGKLAAFMGGPWGLAISLAVAALSPMIEDLLEGAEASNKAAAADDAHAAAAKALKDAIDRLNGSQAALNHTTQQGITDDINAAEATRQLEVRKRSLLDAMLRTAQEQVRQARSQAATNTGSAGGVVIAGARVGSAMDDQGQIEAALKLNAARSDAANTAIRSGRGLLVRRDVAEKADPAKAEDDRFNDASDRLQRLFDRGKISAGQYDAQLLKLTQTHEAAAKAVRDHAGASSSSADAQARLAAADTGVQRAEAQLAITRADVTKGLREHTLTQAQATARLTEARQAVNAARQAAHDHAASVRDQAQATRDLNKDLREEQELISFAQGRSFTPVKIVDRKAETAAYAQRFKAIFGDDDPLGDAVTRYDKEQKLKFDAIEQNAEKVQRQQEEGVGKLTSLFRDGMNGGTKAIWQDFLSMGEDAIAKLAAQWLMKQAAGSSGLLGKITGLFGGSPTLGGLSLGGGIADPGVGTASVDRSLIAPHFASGSQYTSGGLAWVNENGPEIEDLPNGTRVYPAAISRQIAQDAFGGGGGVTHNYDLRGAVVYENLMKKLEARSQMASAQGAAGGRALSRRDQARSARRTLGTRG